MLKLFSQTPSPQPSATAITLENATLGEIMEQAGEAVTEWSDQTFEDGFLSTLFYSILIVVVAFVAIKLLQKFLKEKLSGNMAIFYRLLNLAVIVFAVIAILVNIRPLKTLGDTLLASSGIAAVVLGLAAQGTLGNLFSGLSISVAKPYVVGEFIEILNTTPPVSGIVEAIGLRHTTIRDVSNKSIVIPNSVIDQEMLRTTHSQTGNNVCSFLFVSVSYESNLDLAREIITRAVLDHPRTLDLRSYAEKEDDKPAVDIYITELEAYAIQLRASVWTRDTAAGFAALSDLRFTILQEFSKNGIEIPYPRQDIFMDSTKAKK